MTTRHELRTQDRVAYLIEMPSPPTFGMKTPGPLWFAVQGYSDKHCPATFWSPNAHQALQFSRRDQAENFLQFVEMADDPLMSSRFSGQKLRCADGCRVTEHIFQELAP